jgi:hypothetical protein
MSPSNLGRWAKNPTLLHQPMAALLAEAESSRQEMAATTKTVLVAVLPG